MNTGIDKRLIERLHNILIVVSCGHNVNYDNFLHYCGDTAKFYVELYPWYYMPPSVHKLLIHGPVLTKNSVSPIGQFSEEVLESSHKILKFYRREHSRKISREKTNKDIFLRLLLHSDPLLTLSGISPK